jgi:hypothetical protein
MPPQIQKRIRERLQKRFHKVPLDLYDDGPLWDRNTAKADFQDVLFCQKLDEDFNSFEIKKRSFFESASSWATVGKYPGQYFNLFLLLNFMHAWCRDLLELGQWAYLDNLNGKISGRNVRQSAMRMMRFLSRLRDLFLQSVDEDDRRDNRVFLVADRMPAMDLYLLALYNGVTLSLPGLESFLKTKSGQAAFTKDPVHLGEPLFLNLKICSFCRLGGMATASHPGRQATSRCCRHRCRLRPRHPDVRTTIAVAPDTDARYGGIRQRLLSVIWAG